jgi:hypothetical protein
MQRIDRSTFRGLLDCGHGLECYYGGCRSWASADLAGFWLRAGLGDRRIQAGNPRCRTCGSIGEWQVRPPVPQGNGAPWMRQ